MLLRFTKMHGLGDDFMVIDLVTQHSQLSPHLIRQWSNRRTGVGFDHLLIVEPPGSPEADFRYRVFNADGKELRPCGNDARCFARFVQDKRLITKPEIHAETASGPAILQVRRDGQISVNMGVPHFHPAQVPFQADADTISHRLTVQEQTLDISVVSMGKPHCVTLVDNLNDYPVAEQGALIECHPRFPQRVNAGFMQLIDRHHAQLRVYERGSGETTASSSGACAAAVVGIRRDHLQSPVTMRLPGGNLTIEWAGADQPVKLTGPATRVYEGQIRV